MPRPLKVLVVDDDPTSLEMIEMVMQSLGHQVSTRSRALGTSSEIVDTRPDVVLLDVHMPGLPGNELLPVIREALRPLRWEPQFIFVSGSDAETLDRLVAETGALGAIEKRGGPEAIASGFQELLSC